MSTSLTIVKPVTVLSVGFYPNQTQQCSAEIKAGATKKLRFSRYEQYVTRPVHKIPEFSSDIERGFIDAVLLQNSQL